MKKRPRRWVSFKSLNPKVKWPIIISEDWAFYEHKGIDWSQLQKALWESAKKFKLGRGASTISQQLVKNLYLSSHRSIFRKINEVILVFFLENFSSKDWILEQYLNIAEFSFRVDGVGQASWHYFNKGQGKLGYREGAFLAMLMPSPQKYSSSFKNRKLSDFARKRIQEILRKLVTAKVMTTFDLQQELNRSFYWETSSSATLDVENK